MRRPATRLRRRFRRPDELHRRQAARRRTASRSRAPKLELRRAGRSSGPGAPVTVCLRPEDVVVRDVSGSDRNALDVAGRRHGIHRQPFLHDAARCRHQPQHLRRPLDQRRARPRHRAGRHDRAIALPPERLRVFASPPARPDASRHDGVARHAGQARRSARRTVRQQHVSRDDIMHARAAGRRSIALARRSPSCCRSARCCRRRSRTATARSSGSPISSAYFGNPALAASIGNSIFDRSRQHRDLRRPRLRLRLWADPHLHARRAASSARRRRSRCWRPRCCRRSASSTCSAIRAWPRGCCSAPRSTGRSASSSARCSGPSRMR